MSYGVFVAGILNKTDYIMMAIHYYKNYKNQVSNLIFVQNTHHQNDGLVQARLQYLHC